MTAVPARAATVRFALALLLVAFCSTAALAQSDPLVFGHRGARESAPDNSLHSFRAAEAEGADGVELDVRLAKSGEVVVFHDAKVTLPSGRKERVSKLTLEQLRRVDLGQGQRIPTLREVLRALGPEMQVNIEMKPSMRSRGLEKRVASIVREAGASKRVLVSSFDPLSVRRFKKIAPEITAGILARRGFAWRLRARLSRADAVNPSEKMTTEKRVRRMRERGYLVFPWTVNERAKIRDMAEMKVDGLITDKPADARRALRTRRAARARRTQTATKEHRRARTRARRRPGRAPRRARAR